MKHFLLGAAFVAIASVANSGTGCNNSSNLTNLEGSASGCTAPRGAVEVVTKLAVPPKVDPTPEPQPVVEKESEPEPSAEEASHAPEPTVDDAKNGHGNDKGGVDSSNPGQGQSDGAQNDKSDAKSDNGHGNDEGGVDSSNPGQGKGGGAQNGKGDAKRDNGHGNDEGGVDSSNPGQGKGGQGGRQGNGKN